MFVLIIFSKLFLFKFGFFSQTVHIVLCYNEITEITEITERSESNAVTVSLWVSDTKDNAYSVCQTTY